MGLLLKIVGAIIAVLGIVYTTPVAVVIGAIVYLVGFWMNSATRSYLNNNRK